MRVTSSHWTLLGLTTLAAALVGATHSEARTAITPDDQEVSFAEQVLPILQESCVECHGGEDENGEIRAESSLRLTGYDEVMLGSEFGSVVEAGDADASFLVEMIESGDMPDEGDPLTAEQITLIKTWINEGAKNN